MAMFRTPDGLDKLWLILNFIMENVRKDAWRRRTSKVKGMFFSIAFLMLVFAETLFAAMMFSLISVEILGKVVSGAAFSVLVPTVIMAVHIKSHVEGDHFTKWWISRLRRTKKQESSRSYARTGPSR